MSQKVTVSIEDDVDGGPAAETVRFSFGGSEYEIDLSEHNASTFREQLNPFIEHARAVGQPKGRSAIRGSVNRKRAAHIRAWAREQGLSVNERGRIAATVVERYEAASKSA